MWDVVQDIVQKDITKVYKKYERNERLYKHKIFEMEKIMPSFEYEPLVLSPKPETSNEEENRRDIDGAGPSSIKITEELRNLIGGKKSLEREVIE